VVSLTLRSLYPWGNRNLFPLNIRPCGTEAAMDVSENVEIFALVGIRTTIARLSSTWSNRTRFAVSAPKFRAAINNKRTCLTFTGILFPSQQLRTWKRIETLRVYPMVLCMQILYFFKNVSQLSNKINKGTVILRAAIGALEKWAWSSALNCFFSICCKTVMFKTM